MSTVAAAHMQVVAALSKVLAQQLESGSLWPGQAQSTINQIQEALDSARAQLGPSHR